MVRINQVDPASQGDLTCHLNLFDQSGDRTSIEVTVLLTRHIYHINDKVYQDSEKRCSGAFHVQLIWT